MSANTEKPEAIPNVLTINRPSASRQASGQSINLTATNDIESAHTLTPSQSLTQTNEKLTNAPFYKAPTQSESRQNINSYDTDVEACLSPQKTKNTLGDIRSNNDTAVWPGQQALKRKKKMMRKERGKQALCGWMAGMPKKTQIWIKIGIALLVVGAAIGIGVGVSKAVGGGIWKNKESSNAPIEGNKPT